MTNLGCDEPLKNIKFNEDGQGEFITPHPMPEEDKAASPLSPTPPPQTQTPQQTQTDTGSLTPSPSIPTSNRIDDYDSEEELLKAYNLRRSMLTQTQAQTPVQAQPQVQAQTPAQAQTPSYYAQSFNNTSDTLSNTTPNGISGIPESHEVFKRELPEDTGKPEDEDKFKYSGNTLVIVLATILAILLCYAIYLSNGLRNRVEKVEDSINAINNGGLKTSEVIYKDNGDLSTIADSVLPSIVSINATGVVEYYSLFGTQRYNAPISGSGIIINKTDDKLYIVTNNHIVEDTDGVSVQFMDGSSVSATVNGTSADNDVAVITVDLKDIEESTLNAIKIADLNTDKSSLHVGNKVMAIGNALGYGQSITVGYISALDRSITTENGVKGGLIQTDAAINPGNSGGALVDMNGKVIGINVAKYSSVEIEGVCYSIPVADVNEIISLISTEKIPEEERGVLGIQYKDIDAETTALYGMPTGVFVAKITNSALKEAGLMEKDIIVKLNGRTATTGKALINMLSYHKTGDEVVLTVKRLVDGEYKDFEVKTKLIARPDSAAPSSQPENNNNNNNPNNNQSPFDGMTDEELEELFRMFQLYYGDEYGLLNPDQSPTPSPSQDEPETVAPKTDDNNSGTGPSGEGDVGVSPDAPIIESGSR